MENFEMGLTVMLCSVLSEVVMYAFRFFKIN